MYTKNPQPKGWINSTQSLPDILVVVHANFYNLFFSFCCKNYYCYKFDLSLIDNTIRMVSYHLLCNNCAPTFKICAQFLGESGRRGCADCGEDYGLADDKEENLHPGLSHSGQLFLMNLNQHFTYWKTFLLICKWILSFNSRLIILECEYEPTVSKLWICIKKTSEIIVWLM